MNSRRRVPIQLSISDGPRKTFALDWNFEGFGLLNLDRTPRGCYLGIGTSSKTVSWTTASMDESFWFRTAEQSLSFSAANQSFSFPDGNVYNVQAAPTVLVKKSMQRSFLLDWGKLWSTSNSFRIWEATKPLGATTVSFVFKLSWNVLIQACRGKYFFSGRMAILFTRRHGHIKMETLWDNCNLPQLRFSRKQNQNRRFFISLGSTNLFDVQTRFPIQFWTPTNVSAQQSKVSISKYIRTRNCSTLSILCKKVVDVRENDSLLDT